MEDYGFKHTITSKLEHHAVLHTLQFLEEHGKTKLSYVNTNEQGEVDLEHLDQLLKASGPSLVSLMHANNEIGNLTDIAEVGEICEEHKSIFHSDTVQAVGHYKHDLQELKVHCMVGSAHKFHGPKGTGFLYIRADHKICPFIHGGAQERNMRGGTENVCGIVGIATALQIAYDNMQEHHAYIQGLKDRAVAQLRQKISGVKFNGLSEDAQKSLYTVLNVSFPPGADNEMLLFNLDIQGISASGGSACSSGSNVGSHVLAALGSPTERGSVRFSFSKYNTPEEVDYVVEKLAEIYSVNA